MALSHPVLLERVGGEFEFHGLAGADEADVFIGYPDLGLEPLVERHQARQDRSGLHDCASRMGRKVLDNAILGRLQ